MIQVVASAIVIKDNNILLSEMLLGPCRGMLVPPGGKVNEGERFVDAALRELLEETGLCVEFGILDTIDEVIWTSQENHIDAKHIIHANVLVPSFNGRVDTIEPTKHKGFVWIELDELKHRVLSPSLELFLQGMKFKGKYILE